MRATSRPVVVMMGYFDAARRHERGYEVRDEAHGRHGDKRSKIVNGHGLPEADERRQRDRQANSEQRGDVDERADRRRARIAEGELGLVVVALVVRLRQLAHELSHHCGWSLLFLS